VIASESESDISIMGIAGFCIFSFWTKNMKMNRRGWEFGEPWLDGRLRLPLHH
jgi:hypothetical protein